MSKNCYYVNTALLQYLLIDTAFSRTHRHVKLENFFALNSRVEGKQHSYRETVFFLQHLTITTCAAYDINIKVNKVF